MAFTVFDALPPEPSMWLILQDPDPWVKVKVYAICFVCVSLVCLCMIRVRLSGALRDLIRYVGFVTLHLADYATNVLTMYIIYETHHPKYLFVLAPVHCTIGVFCMYTAATSINWQQWRCPPLCRFAFMVVVMGLMQGVQVKLARDDYQQQKLMRRGDLSCELQVPSSMPARFHCKAMDGILEGTVFAFVGMYALLKKSWQDYDPVDLDPWQAIALYTSAVFSFITTGLAVMEVDHRTSAAVQRLLNNSSLAQIRHLLFRASEVGLRLMTVLIFCTFMRPLPSIWWLAFVLIVADYLLGVMLLLALGGHDPIREAAVLLAVPLFMLNVMQFVDTPGMSLQAQRISRIVVPFRTLELIGVLTFCCIWAPHIRVVGNPEPEYMWLFLWEAHTEWVVSWVMSAIMYYLLLLTYAFRMKSEADLHSAVAYGDVAQLRELLCGSELVLDINRYGPDGRTPLHLAAVRAQVGCMRLLIEQRANIHARTGDRLRNTALHLSVTHKLPVAVRYLCQLRGTDSQLINAANSESDTALHIAARKQNVGALQELLRVPVINCKLKNNKGQLAAEVAPSEKFGFDRNSPECAISDLFRHAELGIRPPAVGSFELATLATTHTETHREGGVSTPASENRDLGASRATPRVDQSERASMEQVATNTSSVEGDMIDDSSKRMVPLQPVRKATEKEFLKRSTFGITSLKNGSSPVTDCGISSFMLSAGLGALSRAFLESIREEDNGRCGHDDEVVKASFDDFTEITMLGQGAFGKVMLVRQKDTGELFAMKLMDKAKFKAQKITSKAHSEQFILKTTRHKFIVGLQYAFQGSTFWALVMDYCCNGDLQELLVKYGDPGMLLQDCARLGGEVLLALTHLHKIQVIFRDLKLENVVLDVDFRAKLTDFGLAKKLYTSADARTMCGSYGYAAPEIMLNTGRYTYAVDLYSYGVLLYMLLSGGEPGQNDPQQRLPPMRHSSLKRKLREAEKNPPGEWAEREVGGLELVSSLTSEDPQVRGTSAEVQEKRFFKQYLDGPLEALYAKEGCYKPQRRGGGSQVESTPTLEDP